MRFKAWTSSAFPALVFLLALFEARPLFAKCEDKGPIKCTLPDGRKGFRECGVNGQMGPCISEEPKPPKQPTGVHGTVSPKYYVLTIVYAPPGKKGGDSNSEVSYESKSSAGTTTSASTSFKDGVGVEASIKAGFASIGGQFKFEKTDTASGELEIEKTETYVLQDPGPSVDGIDHDRDLIYLLLEPKLDVTVDGNSVQWAFSGGGVPQHVSVGWLRNPSSIPKGVKDRLDSAGLTPADYAEILKLDPFANGNTSISPDRYLDTNIIIPYEPPYDQNDEGPTQGYTIDNQTSDTSTHSYEKSTDVGMTIGAEGGFGKVFEAKLEVSKTWTWTNGGSKSTAAVRGETATVKIGSPSFGYPGPTAVAVHFDRLYKTFLFSFVPVNAPLRATGTIKYLTQGPVKAHVVYLRAGGKTYRTVTNRRGEYRFFGAPMPGMEIEVQGIAKRKIESMQQPIANFTLPDKAAGQLKKK